MKIKLRQVTDNIHETIYLSSLESELISTPYFYRLHDIYQSSTVYMTFPANRTKRYEHSLGTMELASTMLFSSISNASQSTRNILFRNLRAFFDEIIDLAILQSENARYFVLNKEKIDDLFTNFDYSNTNSKDIEDIIKNNVKKAVNEGYFSDSALDYFQYYPTGIDSSSNLDTVLNLFLYRCLLQAVRIVALFHDVGHPPYSHIIEDALKELYDKCVNDKEFFDKCDKKKLNQLKKCLEPYATKEEKKSYKCNTLFSKSTLVRSPIHEKIGLSLIQTTLDDVISDMMKKNLDSSIENQFKIANTLYCMMVVEFVLAILTEQNNLFKSFHKIVDGILDADRLDYIMRDSFNSGVDWGKIPYKRLINSAKLICLQKENINSINDNDETEYCSFAIGYPKKLSDDIEDLLLMRYKIFARINFHHRSVKTAASLKAAVIYISENYLLTSDDEKCINPDIKILWMALDKLVGNKAIRIIQWNDSWLISALHRALVNLEMRKIHTHERLKEYLEEILLNKKNYYCLFKRGEDVRCFIEKICNYAELTENKLATLKERELKKFFSNKNDDGEDGILDTPKYDAMDSIHRINSIKEAINNNDLKALCDKIPPQNGIEEIVQKCLDRLKSENYILDGVVLFKEDRMKLGLPLHEDIFDEIYLYDDNGYNKFNEKRKLSPQINTIKNDIPWLFIYYIPKKNKENNELSLPDRIQDELAKEIGLSLKLRFEELFEKNKVA